MASEPLRPGGPPGLDKVLDRSFHVPTTPTLGREEAANRVRQKVNAERERLPPVLELELSDQPVMRGALFDAAGVRVPFPPGRDYDRCYVALLDPSPTMRWAHSAWWAFVPAGSDGPVVLQETELPQHSSGPVYLQPMGSIP